MSRAGLRELVVLFAISSALTLAIFFLALWLLPDQPFTPFLLPRFPWCLWHRVAVGRTLGCRRTFSSRLTSALLAASILRNGRSACSRA